MVSKNLVYYFVVVPPQQCLFLYYLAFFLNFCCFYFLFIFFIEQGLSVMAWGVFGDCLFYQIYLVVCSELLYYCIVALLLFFILVLRVSFFLWDQSQHCNWCVHFSVHAHAQSNTCYLLHYSLPSIQTIVSVHQPDNILKSLVEWLQYELKKYS